MQLIKEKKTAKMLVLGIETSCDETGIALYDTQNGLKAHTLYSQVKLHADYGGVVPELASRDHIRKVIPLIEQAMQEAGVTAADIDGIAYTRGPGLIGALLVGSSVARSLAFAWQVPVVGVHHMEGHLLAPLLDDIPLKFPFVALLVSGGHSMLVKVDAIGEYEVLGESVDDAAGEAFDKTAKLLDLDYPGGPRLAKLADKGTPGRFTFPRPMTDRPGLQFSFSGLKTAAANTIRDIVKEQGKLTEQDKADVAVAFQDAVIDTLLIKCRRALKQCGVKQLVIAGGVSANVKLREQVSVLMKKQGGKAFYPAPEFCTDNGAMIAYAGAQRLAHGQQDKLSDQVQPRWPLEQIEPLNQNTREG